jgi:hypothetical protein
MEIAECRKGDKAVSVPTETWVCPLARKSAVRLLPRVTNLPIFPLTFHIGVITDRRVSKFQGQKEKGMRARKSKTQAVEPRERGQSQTRSRGSDRDQSAKTVAEPNAPRNPGTIWNAEKSGKDSQSKLRTVSKSSQGGRDKILR